MINILPKEAIEANIHVIKSTLETFENMTTGAEILDFLGQITSLQATATETQASAKYWLLNAIDFELDRQAAAMKGEKIPPSIAKMRADAKVKEWHFIHTYCERLSSNISHAIDAVRTKISYIKQELDNSKYSNAA